MCILPWSKTYIGIHVKYTLLLSDFNEIWIFATDFRKILKYYENLFSASRVVHADGQTNQQTEALSSILRRRLKIQTVYTQGHFFQGNTKIKAIAADWQFHTDHKYSKSWIYSLTRNFISS
jgi:hypothetical protein